MIAQPFGRVFDLWSLDMGLGSGDPRFMVVNEEDLGPGVVNDADDQEDAVVNDQEEHVQAGSRSKL